MLVMARVIEKEQGDVDRALDMNRQILELDERNEQALDALERLYLGKGQFEELLDIYEKKLDLIERRRRADRDPGEDRSALRGRGQGRQEGGRRLLGDPRRRRRRAERAALRSIAIYLRNAQWKELADVLGRQITIVGPEDDKPAPRRAEVPARPAQGAAPRATSPGAIDAYRDILDIDVGHPKAREALEIHLRGDDKQKLVVAGILEPVYEQLQEWAPLVGVHEIQLAAEKDSLRRTSLLLRIGELQRTKLLDAEKAFDAYARAFKEDPSTEAAKDQLEALAPLIEDGWTRLVKLFEGALDEAKDLDRQARARARDEGRAHLRGAARQQRQGGRVLQARARDRARRPRRRSPRSRRSSRATRSTPSCSRSIAAGSTSRTSPTSASSSCSASPRSTRRC